MASFDFVVDTRPMAQSVSEVSGHVIRTTQAVVAMESAVIKSEEIASNNICKNVNTGFHILIQSQVSQKAASYFSEMSSKMILLMEFAKNLSQTQNRMNSDYQRLKREYSKIFHSLDKTLENRIRQLDKYAMELGDIKKNIVTTRIVRDAPSALIYGKDTQETAQLMFSARIKSKAGKALDNMTQSVFSTQFYKDQLESVLRNSNISVNSSECIPVVFTEEKSLISSGTKVNNLFISESIGNGPKGFVENTVMENLDKIQNQTSSQSEKNEINNEFMKLVSESNLDERLSKKIISLYNGGKE
ncbi:MAG: hypothetical protein HUK25_05700 [Treponema sp.]|nr:hypothetical protein [Treponema sp.]